MMEGRRVEREDGGCRVTVHAPEAAMRVEADGGLEEGELFFVEKVVSRGLLRATYEYNIYRWPRSDRWEADVVSPCGWYDLSPEETMRVVREFGILQEHREH